MTITIGFLDIETTGLEQAKGHRIIEVAFLVFSYDELTGEKKALGKYIQRINPDRSIDAKAQAVHKISINDLINEPRWEAVVGKISKIFDKLDLMVCHNVRFDMPFISLEMARAERRVPVVDTFCTMDNGRFATFDGAIPSLKVLSECFGITYDVTQAHSALYDITLTAKCFFMGLERGVYVLNDFNQLENVA